MPSTSVHVRGKRKAPSASPQHSDADRPAKVKRSIGQIKASRLASPRTKLESLPTEVLEDVLLYSLNVALPRCSHLIGAKLSDRATLIRFCLVAFDKTWDRHLGGKSRKAKPNSDAKAAADDAKDAKVETAVLAMPWAKLDLLLQAQQTWANRYSPRLQYERLLPWSAPAGASDPLSGPRFNALEFFDQDYAHMIHLWKADVSSRNAVEPMHEINHHTRVPHRLINGPWNEEQLRRIFWLWRGGLNVSALVRAIPWEYRLMAFRNATRDPSDPPWAVIKCIMSHSTYLDFPLEAKRALARELDGRLAAYNKLISQGEAEDSDLGHKLLLYYRDLIES